MPTFCTGRQNSLFWIINDMPTFYTLMTLFLVILCVDLPIITRFLFSTQIQASIET